MDSPAAACYAMELSSTEILQALVNDGTISMAAVAEAETMLKEQQLAGIVHLEKIKQMSDGRLYIHIGRKAAEKLGKEMFAGKDRTDLINKLYDAAFGQKHLTLRDGYKQWQVYRIKIGTVSKTVKENDGDWKKYLEGSSLADMEISKIKAVNVKDYFLMLTKDRKVTYKRLGGVKTILNGIMRRSVELGIIDFNCINDIDYVEIKKRCKATEDAKDDYSLEEKELLMEYLRTQNGVYEQAILFAFNLFLRIGEIVPLKYEDIRNGLLYIRRSSSVRQDVSFDEEGNLTFSNWHSEIDEHIKGNTNEGFRYVPLNEEALAIVNAIYEANPESEYLFMYQGRQLNPNTFNRHLKKACNAVGVKYRPSHQIRFTNASIVHNSGVEVEELSSMMGHSNTQTTFRYLRKKKPTEETSDKVRNALTVKK